MKNKKIGIIALVIFMIVIVSQNIMLMNKTNKLIGTVPSRNIDSNEVEYTPKNKSVQASINELLSSANTMNDKISNLESLNISSTTLLPNANIKLHNCTGSLYSNNLTYKIVDKTLIISGRIEINISASTGSSPGISVTIPDSRKLDGDIYALVSSTSYIADPRYGEGTMIYGVSDSSTFQIITSETHKGVGDNKYLVLYVPMTFIGLK